MGLELQAFFSDAFFPVIGLGFRVLSSRFFSDLGFSVYGLELQAFFPI